MNRQFHNKRQSLTVTDKQADVDKVFDLSEIFYWAHVQYKIREKVIENKLQSSTD